MEPKRILDEQRITVKRGRMNGLGFEPAFNSYFDFYLSSKYVDPPLLQLEDVTFHLYLRKNLNDTNADWKMPSYNQIIRKFRIGQGKLTAMMNRLERAHLLKKVSGVRTHSPNVTNDYILSDPIPYLDEFLAVVEAGLFDPTSEMDVPATSKTDVPGASKIDASPTSETDEDQQTSSQHTDNEQMDDLLTTAWKNVLGILKQHLLMQSYQLFLADTQLLGIEEGTATIATPRASAVTWLERQMSNSIQRLLSIEMRVKIQTVKVVVE